MRVIAGKARSLPLKTLPGTDTRPTTDRIKETLFNMLQPHMADCRFLDLCSGSGAIGIEALSRGAKEAVFVEKNSKACACIRENLRFTRLGEQAKIMKTDALSALRMLEAEAPFDYIFMDPPYGKEIEKGILMQLASSPLADEYTLIVVEADLQTDFSYLDELGLRIEKYKKYKTNAHVFIVRQKKERPEEKLFEEAGL